MVCTMVSVRLVVRLLHIKFRTYIHPLHNQNHEYKNEMFVDFSSKNLQSLISKRKQENYDVEGRELAGQRVM